MTSSSSFQTQLFCDSAVLFHVLFQKLHPIPSHHILRTTSNEGAKIEQFLFGWLVSLFVLILQIQQNLRIGK